MKSTEQGFSLIELLIVLVIIGILASITYPIYNHAMIKTHRTEAKIALINLANQMEIYYLANNKSYADANFSKLHLNNITEKNFYHLTIKIMQGVINCSPRQNFPIQNVIFLC